MGDRSDRRLQAERRDHPQNLRRYRRVDPHVPERSTDATPPVIDVGVIAHIAGHAASSVVQDPEFAPAAPAAQQADQ